jgi:hypothetical protein
MSKVKVVGGLLLAAAIAVGSVVAERFIHLPPDIMSGVVILLVLLACYPAVTRWSPTNRNLTFKVWAMGAAVASFTATVILLIVNRP